MVHIIVDGVVCITDTINSKEFCRTGIKNAVRALRKGMLVGKVGRPAAGVGEKEQRVLDIIHIEAKTGTFFDENEDEYAPFTEVSMYTTYGLVKHHPELMTGALKNLDINRLAVSCRSVLKPKSKTIDELHEKYSFNPAFIISIDESSTCVLTDSKQLVVHTADTKAAVAADGYAFPSVIMWPSAKLPEELKRL
ncbi:uncharacterized protein MONOS_1522 [Monocercomonoides exilis]|uniref:uncharacterized protein n=1 Tax=Monocercomonoides exilis TaxID=2049356 RepID=UPI00355A058E|nr:hypothetical protein MONOS_1522 [Monocercomonoides exilis]|eukprot:MONOS_1522.1-p1 / transcript=MONOS_1522.1 / gene=MONOS_1522 / organism=Monocercomonoides_exilis_PA203 / gene_product=unspecified product / transcript_product=unspecified product / location=Mono_scaffold00027:51774-52487(+) / protein_length=194 / sequence_SO=supercontig / SO=protein_coding / is_pseudo=false